MSDLEDLSEQVLNWLAGDDLAALAEAEELLDELLKAHAAKLADELEAEADVRALDWRELGTTRLLRVDGMRQGAAFLRTRGPRL